MDKSRFVKALRQIERQHILVIGDVMVDAYVMGKVERISPEAPVPVVAVKERTNRLGGAANVAFNIKSLGAQPILCSVIGQDTKGKELIDLLKDHELSAEGIVQSEKRITTTKFRVLGNNTQMLRVDEEDLSPIDKNDREQLEHRIAEIIETHEIKAIVFEDYDKGVISQELIDFVSNLARSQNIYVSADPKRNNFHHYQHISLLKPNLKELNEGLNIQIENGDFSSIEKAAQQLHKNQSLEEVMITLSEHGLLILDSEKAVHIPTIAKSIADVSGAGDTVISVISLMRVAGYSLEEAARIANLAGGLVCEEVGVMPIRKEQLIESIENI